MEWETWRPTGKEFNMFKLLVLFSVLFIKTHGDQLIESKETEYSLKKTKNINHQTLELNRILDEKLKNYPSHKLLPKYNEQESVHVDANIRVLELLDVSEMDMHMKLNLVLDISWVDHAIRFTNAPFNDLLDQGVWVGDSVKDKIWTPPVSILNEIDSAQLSPGFVMDSISWHPSGRLYRRIKVVTTVSCSMSLENFPIDEQKCSIIIGTLIYNADEMMLRIHPFLDPIFSSSVKNFELRGVRVSPIVQEYQWANNTVYSYELLFRRYLGYYVIGTYFPSALVVVISWLTFWMARDAAVERMALGVTCVLTITTLLIPSQASSPKVSYVKAIDIYVGACFTLVFATLFESSMVGYLLRKVRMEKTTGRQLSQGENMKSARPRGFASVVHRVMAGRLEETERPRVTKFIVRCDVWCRVIFPLIFLIFNVVYWTYYKTCCQIDTQKGWKEPEFSTRVLDDAGGVK